MLTTNYDYIIHGAETIVSWEGVGNSGKLFLYHRTSFWFWKNYTPIPDSGYLKLIAKAPFLKVKIKRLEGLRMVDLESIELPVHHLKIKNLEQRTGLLDSISLCPSLIDVRLNDKATLKGLKRQKINSLHKLNSNSIHENRITQGLDMALVGLDLDE